MSLKSKLRTVCTKILVLSFVGVAQLHAAPLTSQFNQQYAKQLYPELIEIRRDLFNHPEISGKEKRTSQVVANYLTQLGLEVKTNIGGYGVVGILKGAKPGKRIIWRSDMDAAHFEYGQQRGVAHVCGHDVHTTIGLGIANTLSQKQQALAGTVYFLFQPAEESQNGAKAMIEDGLFDLIEADEIYAAHAAPMPTGVIVTSPNNVYAHSRAISMTFTGNQAQEAISATVDKALSSLVRLKSPNQFTNLLNVVDPELGLGNPDTIYQDYVFFGGKPQISRDDKSITFTTELFAANHQDIALVLEKLEQHINASPFNNRLQSIRSAHQREGVYNDRELISAANTFLTSEFGNDVINANYGKIPFASEDFGHFQKAVPGVYFFIGVANAEKGNVAFPHMPGFEVDEKVIEYGVSRFATLIEYRLKQ